MQLRSDHQASQLSLGHLHRIEDALGRKDARGQGFELRSDGHGAIRAQEGLLISTEARPGARSHITDMGETLARLAAGRDLHEGLADAAVQAGAQEAGDQQEVAKAIEQQNEAIEGQGADPARNRFAELRQPHLVVASPAGIQTSTAGSTHQASAGHHALTAHSHVSIGSGKSLLASAGQAIRMFAYNAGMRLVAAAGDIEIQALRHSIEVIARLDIRQEARRITITARDEVVINGGTSYTRWSQGGIVSGTNALWRVHAASHSLVGADNKPGPKPLEPATLEELKSRQSLAFTLLSHPAGGRPFADEPYTLYKDGAKVEDGVTDSHGRLVIKDHPPGAGNYLVRLSNGHEIELPVKEALDALDDQLAAQGFRAAQDDTDDRQRHHKHQGGR